MAEYALSIDENRLEDWVELFDEGCDYKVVTREKVEQGLPNVLMWCDTKNMLRDRVESHRNVNLYNLHYDRHVLGLLRALVADGVFEASSTVRPQAPVDKMAWVAELSLLIEDSFIGGGDRDEHISSEKGVGVSSAICGNPCYVRLALRRGRANPEVRGCGRRWHSGSLL